METGNINKVITALVELCNKLDNKINITLLAISCISSITLVSVIVYFIVTGRYWESAFTSIGLIVFILSSRLVSLNMSRKTVGGMISKGIYLEDVEESIKKPLETHEYDDLD